MKKTLLLTALVMLSGIITAQVSIATRNDPLATSGHNQRKIIRDSEQNVYVVFSNILSGQFLIKGVKYDRASGEWTDAFVITEGKSPTLAVSRDTFIRNM